MHTAVLESPFTSGEHWGCCRTGRARRQEVLPDFGWPCWQVFRLLQQPHSHRLRSCIHGRHVSGSLLLPDAISNWRRGGPRLPEESCLLERFEKSDSWNLFFCRKQHLFFWNQQLYCAGGRWRTFGSEKATPVQVCEDACAVRNIWPRPKFWCPLQKWHQESSGAVRAAQVTIVVAITLKKNFS